MRLGRITLLAALMAAGTWLAGWWAVPAVAALGQLFRRETPAWHAAMAAGLGWGTLLLLIPHAPLGRLSERVGGIFGLPPWAMVVLVPVYASLLGWSAARVVAALTRVRPSSSRRSPVSPPAPGP